MMFTISIMGRSDSNIEFIKLMLIENANRAGIDLKVVDEYSLDALIAQGITKLPAVNINGKIIPREDKGLIFFFREVNSAILRECNYGNMKRLIVPIDFSDCSKNALAYAQSHAKNCNGVVKIIFVFDNAVSIHPEMNDLNQELMKNAMSRLENFRDNANANLAKDDWSSPLIESEFGIGNVADGIVRFAADNQNAMIVMGSQCKSNASEFLLGSVSSNVMARSKQPVLIIPPNFIFKQLRHLAYCSNDLDLDKEQIFNVLDIVKRCKPFVHLVHIDNDNRNYEAMELLELVRTNYYNQLVSYDLVFGEHVGKIVGSYCEEKQVDMIALSKRNRGFFEGLFHRSFTKEIIEQLKIPLMVVHRE